MSHPGGLLINLLILFVRKGIVYYWTFRSSFCHSYTEGPGSNIGPETDRYDWITYFTML
jgi:hypothetical protein